MVDGRKIEKTQGAETAPRRCWIYRGTRRGELYLYLAKKDDFDAAPKALIEKMGRLRLVMELELFPGRKLARANVDEVMKSLEHKGYYLQLPPTDMPGRHRLQ